MYLIILMGWGILAAINLYDCDKNMIKNKVKIKDFINRLCRKINVKKVGPTIVKRFGKGSLKGYSVMQFIEASTIIVHFDEKDNRAFIDIFSCKKFNEKEIERFSKKFFKAKKSKIKILIRK